MDTIAKVRFRRSVGKESISSIARELNLSRPTVRKHWGAGFACRTKVFAPEVRISGKWGSNRSECRPRENRPFT